MDPCPPGVFVQQLGVGGVWSRIWTGLVVDWRTATLGAGSGQEAGARTQERPGGGLELVAAVEVQRRGWTEKIFTGNGEDCD